MAAPASLYLENLLLGTNVIEAARAADVAKTVVVGTICSYPKHTPVPFRESSLWQGYPEETNAPYGIAKLAQLVHLQANRAQYGQRGAYVMPTNLYGPGDSFDLENSHVLPALIRKFHEANEAGEASVTVWGTGTPRREFLHVDDLADACVFLMQHYSSPEIVNVGWGRDISIGELAETVRDIVGFEGEIVYDTEKPDGTPRKLLDTTRLTALGWTPCISLEEGIRETYAWYCAQT
jgi:GDP-L-fucose synthase